MILQVLSSSRIMKVEKAKSLFKIPSRQLLSFGKISSDRYLSEGSVEKTTREESAAYFADRPRGSQLGAWASKQDAMIPSRNILDEEYRRLESLYQDEEIPLPSFWGGFRIIPRRFDFWQGRSNRLHDRFQYTLKDGNWEIQRLSP